MNSEDFRLSLFLLVLHVACNVHDYYRPIICIPHEICFIIPPVLFLSLFDTSTRGLCSSSLIPPIEAYARVLGFN